MAGIAALPLGACTAPFPATQRAEAHDPVVIVGAGLAGLTAAWELAKANRPFVLYEASSRIGGRVWTLRDFNTAGQFVELGAELVDTGHEDLRNLCNEIDVRVVKFTEPPPEMVNELFHCRGQVYTGKQFEGELSPLLKAVARARREIQGRRAELAVSWDNPQNAAKYDRMSLAEFLAAQGDVAAWVREMVRIAYVGEMGRDAEEQSALNLILLMDPSLHTMYGESDEAWRVAGGSSNIVDGLHKAIVGRRGGSSEASIRLGHELIAIREHGRHIQLVFSQNGKLHSVNASQVVIAIPFTMLRTVEGIRGLPLDPVKLRSILEYGYGTNAKIMTDFSDRVWRKSGGRLPAFNGFLTTDAGAQTIWETSRDQGGSNGILTDFIGGRAAAGLGPEAGRATLSYLAAMDPRIARSYTGRQRLMNWSQYRWSRGSYSSPLVGQYTSFFGVESQAEMGGRLLFAGEHTSIDFTGFMNGAIESGRRVAKQVLEPSKAAA